MHTMLIPIPPEDDPFWGVDEPDGHHPIRAHVLAALRPVPEPYPAPVAALCRIGDPRQPKLLPGLASLAIGQKHVPDLVRMVRDRHLFAAPAQSPAVWAQIHALNLLATLDSSAMIPDLVPLLDVDCDWLYDSRLPTLLGRSGELGIAPLQAYLADHSRWHLGHSTATRALRMIAQQQPTLHPQVVEILSAVLQQADHGCLPSRAGIPAA
jgi:hypothetical protein